jgi:hypothetical protein
MSPGAGPSEHDPRKRAKQPEQESSGEQTFADLLNGFTFDSGRSRSRREREQPADAPAEQARRHEAAYRHAEPVTGERRMQPPPPPPYDGGAQGQPRRGMTPPPNTSASYPHPTPQVPAYDQEPEYDEEDAAAIVRAYAWTRGRTKSDYHLEIETLVSTSERGYNPTALAQAEHRSVASLCTQPRSVAEVAALLSLPLGVARVLLGDMAGLGLINVHETASVNGDTPDLALMERVLSGLRRL